VDALKGVREAASLSHEICPSSGIFFETTLSSAINISALYSLKIQDLFEYSRIMIRVRCCSTILHLNPPHPSNSPAAVSPTTLLTSGSNDFEQMTYLERIAQSCCVGNPAVLSSRKQSLGQSSQVKRRHSSFTTQQLQQQWKSDDILPLFESQLMDFMEGVEVLRELSDLTKQLRDGISQHKLQRQQQQQERQEGEEENDDSHWAIRLISSLLVLSKGGKEQEEFVSLISSLDQCRHDGDDNDENNQSSLCNLGPLTDHLINSLISIASVYDLNTALIPSLFQYFHPLTSSISNTLLCVLDACLHEAIISCFETPDLLIPNLDPPPTVPAVVSASHLSAPPLELGQMMQTPLQQMPDEVALILQQLASLREENHIFPQLQSHNPPDTSYSFAENPVMGMEKGTAEVELSYGAAVPSSTTEMSNDPEYAAEAVLGSEGEGGEGSNGDGDWVTYYDESSARYYLYSESRGESKWLDGGES
jgi:hypothetical protein